MANFTPEGNDTTAGTTTPRRMTAEGFWLLVLALLLLFSTAVGCWFDRWVIALSSFCFFVFRIGDINSPTFKSLYRTLVRQQTVQCLVCRHTRLFSSVSSVESRIFRLHPSPLFTRLVAVQCLYCQVDEAVTSPICRIRGKRNFCFPIIFIETYFSVGKQSQSTRSLSATAVVIPTCTFAERTNTFFNVTPALPHLPPWVPVQIFQSYFHPKAYN